MTRQSDLISELKTTFSADLLRFDDDSISTYCRDWVRLLDADAMAVFFPENPQHLIQLVQWARKNKVGLVPSGGRTGLSGGAIANRHEVVVSFERMNRIFDWNAIDRTVTCQAGVITEELQKYIWDRGYYYPVDFAATGSSQIGGNLATNAGGVKVVRYGLTRDWVAGLKVISGTGDLFQFNNGLVKNATGLDFRHLFIGSEGILGFIYEATMKFTTQPKDLTAIILGLPDLDSVMNVYQTFRDQLPITAFEYMSERAIECVIEHAQLKTPFATKTPHYLLIEVENTSEHTSDEILAAFEQCMENNWVIDGAISQSETQATEFWRLREDISESLAAKLPYKNDVSVRISQVPQFLRDIDQALAQKYPDFEVVCFGHIGDGNMHINVLKPNNLSNQEFLSKCEGVNEHLFKIIERLGGSVSAEHGVGLIKKPFLEFSRPNAEIALMREVKRVFDPDGILNLGKIFD